MQVELDDLPDELRRQEVRELRRQRLGEGGQVGAFVGLMKIDHFFLGSHWKHESRTTRTRRAEWKR